MNDKAGLKFPAKSQGHLFFFLALLLIFIICGPYLSHRKIVLMDREISDMNNQIDQQKLLYESYRPMKKMLDNSQNPNLSEIQKKGLTLEETNEIGLTLGQLARELGLEPLTIFPEVSSLVGGSGSIIVDARVIGNFKGLRTFVQQVGKLPSLDKIIAMEIREVPQSREMRLKARLFITTLD